MCAQFGIGWFSSHRKANLKLLLGPVTFSSKYQASHLNYADFECATTIFYINQFHTFVLLGSFFSICMCTLCF